MSQLKWLNDVRLSEKYSPNCDDHNERNSYGQNWTMAPLFPIGLFKFD